MNNKKVVENFLYGSVVDIHNSLCLFSPDTIFTEQRNNDRKVRNGTEVEDSNDIFHE